MCPGKCGKVNTLFSLLLHSLLRCSRGLFLTGKCLRLLPTGGLHVSIAFWGSSPTQGSALGSQFSSGDYFTIYDVDISVSM